jgi:8-hydroxy-5-deazaflavin:NADPH oxidoreductase
MRIAIIGSGLMGSKLGTLFARAGHDVAFAYARSMTKLESIARDAGGTARAATPADAVANADAILLAIHWSRLDDVLAQTHHLAGKTVVSCSLPMNAGDTALAVGHTSSGIERLAERAKDARVVAAFNTVPSEVFFRVYDARATSPRPSLVYYGDDATAKAVAITLIRDIGFEPLDAGPLTVGRYAEPFALLVGQLAYEGARGPEVAYRFVWPS